MLIEEKARLRQVIGRPVYRRETRAVICDDAIDLFALRPKVKRQRIDPEDKQFGDNEASIELRNASGSNNNLDGEKGEISLAHFTK